MAYPALVSLAQTIDLILNHNQHSISPEVKDQLISIHKHVTIILLSFPENFPEKANSFEAVIKEVTHVAEDIIELFMSEHVYEPSVAQLKSNFKHQLRKGKYEHIRRDFHHELKDATEEIQSIAEIATKIKNRSITVKDEYSTAAVSSSSRVATVQKDAMVGLNDDATEIKSRLCGGSAKLDVVPIVGMGGIGKTTLARNVYDDSLIVEYFDIRGWVTISQDYSVKEIVSVLLSSMKILDTKIEPSEAVYKNLKCRRYLIVLDDMWSPDAWDDLKMMFPNDGEGSRIMLTTRLSDVASYADSYSPLHEMRLMDEDQSWNLLRRKLFEQDKCPDELQYVGMEIARSCGGLPLAIVLMSGLLSTVDQTETAWKNISENIKFAISANDEQIDEILSLSYSQLPRHLKPCFLYMGGFPEDYEMRVSKLIKLWVAEGFLKPNPCNTSSEEAAEEYLEDLVKRSLVLVTERKSDGRIKNFSMHDLTREMCRKKAQEENFILNLRFLQGQTKTPRRLTVFLNDLDFPETFDRASVRSIITLEHGLREARCYLGYFRLLWILDLSDAYHNNCFSTLPAEVFELVHLRYLAFNFPCSVIAGLSNLRNLQTLIISSTFVPSFLLETWSLPHLRHLVISSGFSFSLPLSQEGETFALENLRTLSVALNFICTREIVKAIPNLEKLGISYTAHRDFEEDYQLHNLVHLQQLKNLKLKIFKSFRRTEKVNPIFPKTLKKLTLSGLQLPWEDLKTIGSLPNLEVLKLRDHACVGDTWETAEGEFPGLQFLLIEKSELKCWNAESSGVFPRLKRLVLLRCWSLKEIPSEIGEIPSLEVIEVDDENTSLVESAKGIQLEYQENYGNVAFQVRLVRS